jgi:hypothetical protein
MLDMARARIIYDAPRYRRWRAAVVACAGVVAGLLLWEYGHRAGGPAREGAVARPASARGALPHEIAADPFAARDWPAGRGQVAAQPPMASVVVRPVTVAPAPGTNEQPAHAATPGSQGASETADTETSD